MRRSEKVRECTSVKVLVASREATISLIHQSLYLLSDQYHLSRLPQAPGLKAVEVHAACKYGRVKGNVVLARCDYTVNKKSHLPAPNIIHP